MDDENEVILRATRRKSRNWILHLRRFKIKCTKAVVHYSEPRTLLIRGHRRVPDFLGRCRRQNGCRHVLWKARGYRHLSPRNYRGNPRSRSGPIEVVTRIRKLDIAGRGIGRAVPLAVDEHRHRRYDRPL